MGLPFSALGVKTGLEVAVPNHPTTQDTILEADIVIHNPQKITIAPIGPEHIESIQELAADPALARTTNLPDPYPPDGAERFVAKVIETAAAETEVVFAFLVNDELVGVCGFVEIGGTPKRGELGYWIGQPFWGRGYATEGVRLVLQRGFTELQLELIVACHITSNPGSGRVLEKNGFRFSHEGPATRGEKWIAADIFRHFELTRPEWKEGQAT